MRFQDIHTLCHLKYQQAGVVLLDFTKAFDSVLWPALHLILQHFGFGPTFQAWTSTFYKDNVITIMVNSHSSPFFQLGSGVRQGDPLSPSLFVLFLELMLNYLRATTGHLGIQIVRDPTPIIFPRSPTISPVYYAILMTPQNFCGMFDTKLSPWVFSSIRPSLKWFAFTRRNHLLSPAPTSRFFWCKTRFGSLGSSNTPHHLPRGGSPPFLRPSNPALPCGYFVLVHSAPGRLTSLYSTSTIMVSSGGYSDPSSGPYLGLASM